MGNDIEMSELLWSAMFSIVSNNHNTKINKISDISYLSFLIQLFFLKTDGCFSKCFEKLIESTLSFKT